LPVIKHMHGVSGIGSAGTVLRTEVSETPTLLAACGAAGNGAALRGAGYQHTLFFCVILGGDLRSNGGDMGEPDYYELLGVSVMASQREIAVAYRRLAAMLHPDRHINDPAELREWCAQRMRRINEAYAVLRDPLKRAEYDRHYAGRAANPWDGIAADIAVGEGGGGGGTAGPWLDESITGVADDEEAAWSDAWQVAVLRHAGYAGRERVRSARSWRALAVGVLLLIGGGYAGFQALFAPTTLGAAFVMPLLLLVFALLVFIIALNR